MDELTINITWEYFLGIITAILALMISTFCGILTVAWKGSARFTALETSMQWVKDILKELKISSDNESADAFGSHSPINLNKKGETWLTESGLNTYIDSHKSDLMSQCEAQRSTNPYEVQKYIFNFFDELQFDPAFDSKLKQFAFEKGTTVNILRRVGAIYFRNLCIAEFGMKAEDIDAHDPEKK